MLHRGGCPLHNDCELPIQHDDAKQPGELPNFSEQ